MSANPGGIDAGRAASARRLLALYLGLLLLAARFLEPPQLVPRLRVFRSFPALREWVLDTALRGSLEFLLFVPLGALAVAGASGVLAPLVALAAVASTHLVAGTASSPLHLVPALAGAGLGACLMWAGMGGAQRRLGLALALIAILVGLGLGLSAGARSALQVTPSAVESAPLVSAEKRALYRHLLERSPGSLGPDETHTLRLSEHELNVALAWALPIGSPNRRAALRLDGESAELRASAGIPWRGRLLYLNLVARGSASVSQGRLSIKAEQLRLGGLELPEGVLAPLAWCAAQAINEDGRAAGVMAALERVRMAGSSLEIEYGPELALERLAALFKDDGGPDPPRRRSGPRWRA